MRVHDILDRRCSRTSMVEGRSSVIIYRLSYRNAGRRSRPVLPTPYDRVRDDRAAALRTSTSTRGSWVVARGATCVAPWACGVARLRRAPGTHAGEAHRHASKAAVCSMYVPGIASDIAYPRIAPGLARLRYVVHLVVLYNIDAYVPVRPFASASGGPPAAAESGGVTQIRPRAPGRGRAI